ncbi:OPI1 [Candida jiufengensis]|uniref:OPI1 n=1 Tax=Candida jiufengensis TaxID=497108 RepID=UPI0022258554|nr:OPI1 [Candida jiufengensis]KAI5951424.1 OPI1 [Candida jiufengensis]
MSIGSTTQTHIQSNTNSNNQPSNVSISSNISSNNNNSINGSSSLPGPPPPYSKSLPTTSTNMTDISSSSSSSINSNFTLQHEQQQQQQQPSQPRDQNDLVTAAQALTQLTRTNSPPSDVDTIVTRDSDELSTTTTTSNFENNQLPPLIGHHEQQQLQQPQQKHPIVSTVNMVAKHPIVMNAVKYYESQKRNYPSFNYAAGIVEAAALPVVNKIEDNLNTRHQQTRLPSFSQLEANSSHYSSNELTPVVSFDNKQKKRRLSSSSVSSNVSTMSTSYDTKKRLQFCIHILRAANANINSKINFLQRKINETELAVKEERVKLQHQRSHESLSPDQATQKTKTEIIGTVKKIIHLISNFRPSTLGGTSNTTTTTTTQSDTSTTTQSDTSTTPITNDYALSRIPTNISFLQDYELKNTIRDIILHLPASLQQQSSTSSNGEEGNDRIFVLAKESLDMITKLTNVFSEQLVKVETWVNGEEQLQQQQLLNSQGELNEKDVDMKDAKSDDSVSTRCSSEEPDGLTSATKRMRINELIDN